MKPGHPALAKIIQGIDRFFFGRVSATGFGLMRVVWGAAIFLYFAKQWPDVTRYYSAAGQLPPWLAEGMVSPWPSMSVLWFLPPDGVFLAYLLLLILSACACCGLWPRATVIATTVLLISFHARNPWHTTGGDVILRSVGFLLSIGPGGLHAFSLKRARDHCRHWMQKRSMETEGLLPPLTMPAWPQRLLLWQLIIIYGQSLWSKLLGTMWPNGTAVGIALHHTHFGRYATSPVADMLSIIGPFLGWGVMVWEACWLLLLIPKGMMPEGASDRIRRWLLIVSFVVHMGFSALLRLGSFATAMPAILLGNLHGEDIAVMRTMVNRRWRGRISVFYDGQCGFCRRSMCSMLLCDWLHRLRPVDFQSARERHAWAPDIPFAALDRSMHIRLPTVAPAGTKAGLPTVAPAGAKAGLPDGETLKGFSAFRALTWHLPPLWPLAPLLYFPGITFCGDALYTSIAQRRKRCAHERCTSDG